MISQQVVEGELVSSTQYDGVGKVFFLKDCGRLAVVSFFESPLNPHQRKVEVPLDKLVRYSPQLESNIYFRCVQSGIWRRANYGGARPNDKHLLIIKSGETVTLEVQDIYILNVPKGSRPKPSEFLAEKANDAPFFAPLRSRFIERYINQRAACRSISSIPSSRVELEPHQLAVVNRVLQDNVQKYLLADEVGLGKTIEACMLIREHVLTKTHEARIVVAVPKALVEQWEGELANRFLLSADLLSISDDTRILDICSHEDLETRLKVSPYFTMIVIDEAHQLAPLAWSELPHERRLFSEVARCCNKAESTLLLSGTPLNGNEKNFLAMLHCLNSEAYKIDQMGIEQFLSRVEDRERLGGIFSALTNHNDNSSLDSLLNELATLYPNDSDLLTLIEKLRPHVDLFAPDCSKDREQYISELRYYIGENYRLHQRMLRNRRENSGLGSLFPGLAGLQYIEWGNVEDDQTLDAILNHYRLCAYSEPDNFRLFTAENCLEWVDALLNNPLVLMRRAKEALTKNASLISNEELAVLEQLISIAPTAQARKDKFLIEHLEKWLNTHENGKVVVFCEGNDVASHISFKLEMALDYTVERHNPGSIPEFCNAKSDVRVLVCDQRGQDGLNLHGGSRLAVHYSLTRNLSHMEQRLGRLNRYSASLKSIKPVESVVLSSDVNGISRIWSEILDQDINIFGETVASLQYVLESFLNSAWEQFFTQGEEALHEAGEKLRGPDGLIALEKKKIRAQEELLSLDDDVKKASGFADQIYDADCEAEENPKDFSDWIVKGLRFKRVDDVEDAFCFRFMTESRDGRQTLVDIPNLVKTCITGFDLSSGYPPETHPMSIDRSSAARSSFNLLPFRYGQPFVDSIWELLATDTRGSSCAYLRLINDNDFTHPQAYFKLSWLVSAANENSSRIEQRRADEAFSPHVMSMWFSSDGQIIEDGHERELLDLPYDKAGDSYRDFNLKPNVWQKIEDWFNNNDWRDLTLAVTKQATDLLKSRYLENTPGIPLYYDELSAQAVIVCSPKSFE